MWKVWHVLALVLVLVLNGVEVAGERRLAFTSIISRWSFSPFKRGGSRDFIVGGAPEQNPDKFGFIASLRHPPGVQRGDGKDIGGEHYCGGSLIASTVVLTAAHCVYTKQQQNPEVHIGRVLRNGGDGFEVFQTQKTIIHPKYYTDGSWHEFDVALLILGGSSKRTPVELSPNAACFNPSSTCPSGKVLGWGNTIVGDENSLALDLQSVTVPLVPMKDCQDAYGKSQTSQRNLVNEFMVCAGGAGKDSCQADSGGPLIVEKKLAGVVSWGEGCGKKPGVYANVARLSGWIKQQLRQQGIRQGRRGLG